MKAIEKTYSGTKTGTNIRIDWDIETLCLPGRAYFHESISKLSEIIITQTGTFLSATIFNKCGDYGVL